MQWSWYNMFCNFYGWNLCSRGHWRETLQKEYFINISESSEEVHHVGQGEGAQVEEGVGLELGAAEDEEGGEAADEAGGHDEGHDEQVGDAAEDVLHAGVRKRHAVCILWYLSADI